MLPKSFRLRKRTEFAYSFKHGKFYSFKNFNIIVFKRKDLILRIGFSVSKKIGKAFLRNKTKRRLRAIIHENLNQIKKGYNLIFMAKPEIVNLEFSALKSELENGLRKCFLI